MAEDTANRCAHRVQNAQGAIVHHGNRRRMCSLQSGAVMRVEGVLK
jgi:hypothetical protein